MNYFRHICPIAISLMVLLSLTLDGAYSQEEDEDTIEGEAEDTIEGEAEDTIEGEAEDTIEGEAEDTLEGEAEIKIEVIEKPEECERKSQNGDVLVVKYKAVMPISGVEFDSTDDHKRPYYFTLGEGKVMKGWELGLQDMCVGEVRSINIPSGELQKGDQGTGAMIPHDTEDLEYLFELLAIRNTPPPINMFKEMDLDGDNVIQKDELHAYLKDEGLGGLQDGETLDDVIDNIFEGQDKDGDQKIDHEEFTGPKHDEF